MKNDIRIAASNASITLMNSLPGLIPVRVAKKDGWAFDTGVKDENGKTVWSVIEVTVKNTEDTKTSAAFNIDEAIAARQENDAKPKSEPKIKADDPEKAARAAQREKEQAIVEQWCMVNLTDEPMTTTDIQKAIPEVQSVTIMQVGTYLKNIAANNPGTIERKVVKGKPYYRKQG